MSKLSQKEDYLALNSSLQSRKTNIFKINPEVPLQNPWKSYSN